MGYGGKAMQLIQQYFEGKFPSLSEDASADSTNNNNNAVNGGKDSNDTSGAPINGDSETSLLLNEKIAPRKKLPPLLLKLNERRPETLDYLGVAFGLTESLLKVCLVQLLVFKRCFVL